MGVVICGSRACAYRLNEACTASRIVVDSNGECQSGKTYAELMRERRGIDVARYKK